MVFSYYIDLLQESQLNDGNIEMEQLFVWSSSLHFYAEQRQVSEGLLFKVFMSFKTTVLSISVYPTLSVLLMKKNTLESMHMELTYKMQTTFAKWNFAPKRIHNEKIAMNP